MRYLTAMIILPFLMVFGFLTLLPFMLMGPPRDFPISYFLVREIWFQRTVS